MQYALFTRRGGPPPPLLSFREVFASYKTRSRATSTPVVTSADTRETRSDRASTLRRVFVASPGLAIVAIAAIVRIVFAALANLPFESDEATVGLMARHVAYLGELPIYYYGQHYMGLLEPASAALLFRLLGPTVFVLRLAPLLYSVAFVYLTYLFTRDLFGRIPAIATGLYLAIGPLFLVTWSDKARGGYAEMLALGALLLWLTLRIYRDQRISLVTGVAFGVVAGLALWTNPLSVVYTAPCVVQILLSQVVERMLRGSFSGIVAGIIGFFVGGAPTIIDNIKNPFITLHDLSLASASEPSTFGQDVSRVFSIARYSIATIAGFFEASSNVDAFDRARHAVPIVSLAGQAVALLLFVAIAIAVVWTLVRIARGKLDPAVVPAWVGGLATAIYCLSGSPILFITEPRYLLPVYSIVPVAAAFGWQWLRDRKALAGIILALALVVNVAGILRFQPDLAAPWIDGQVVRPDSTGVVALLRDHGVGAFYADYWLGAPIAFLTNETAIPSTIDDTYTIGFNRYIPYAQTVHDAPDPAVLVVTGGRAEEALDRRLSLAGATFNRASRGNLTLYYDIRPVIRPTNG